MKMENMAITAERPMGSLIFHVHKTVW